MPGPRRCECSPAVKSLAHSSGCSRMRSARRSTPHLLEELLLEYVTDEEPGLLRRRAGRGFVYLYPDGRPVRRDAELERIRALAVPPAWTDVWIARQPNAHLQATGRDARGRKHYRYDSQ